MRLARARAELPAAGAWTVEILDAELQPTGRAESILCDLELAVGALLLIDDVRVLARVADVGLRGADPRTPRRHWLRERGRRPA